jgi:hypothetical protein
MGEFYGTDTRIISTEDGSLRVNSFVETTVQLAIYKIVTNQVGVRPPLWHSQQQVRRRYVDLHLERRPADLHQ